jgi:glutaredoxin
MTEKRKVEIFSAGCSVCKETIEMVKRIAGSHEVIVHDMNKAEIASKAKQYGVRSLPAVVVDGKLASCCADRGPEENVLRRALA